MPEFVVAHITDEHQVGERFSMWPLHVTVVPPFEASSLEEVSETVELIGQMISPIQLQIGDAAKFGQGRLVQKLVPSPELTQLHKKLIDAGEKQGWNISGHYVGNYYTPHITQKKGRSFTGSEFILNSLSVVENIGQGYRVIREEISLGESL